MKKIVLLGLVAIFFVDKSFAQEPLIYSDVVEVKNVSKNDLFKRAEIWFTKAYKSSKDVLQTRSKEDGQLIGKALIQYSQGFLSGSANTKGVINYEASIYLKDGRFKYKFENFIHESYGSISLGLITTDEEYQGETSMMFPKKWYTRVWKDIKSQIENSILNLVYDLKKSMNEKAEIEKDDW